MSVLALETDYDQAAAIRQACELAGTHVAVVESAGALLNALAAETPSVVLVPPLVPAAEEAELVQFLRSAPKFDHLEVLMTPVLTPPRRAEIGERSWLRWGSRRSADRMFVAADTASFAERLGWSLARARQLRMEDGESEMMPAALAEARELAAVGAVAAADAPSALVQLLADVVAETGDDVKNLQLSDTTTKLLRKMNDDRRVYPRFGMNELQGLRGARIKFGPHVSLIDVSAGGALLESEGRLQPETEATLEIVGEVRKIVVPFRLLRAQVTALSGSPRYRGACEFKSLLDVSDLLEAAGMLPHSMAMVPAGRLVACNAW